jgi:hypothetical protein
LRDGATWPPDDAQAVLEAECQLDCFAGKIIFRGGLWCDQNFKSYAGG